MAFDKIDIPIKIGRSEYYIGSDRYNFVLGKKKMMTRKKKGEETEVLEFDGNTTTYYGTLDALMTALHKMLIKSKKAETILQLQKNITKAKNEILATYQLINEGEKDGKV